MLKSELIDRLGKKLGDISMQNIAEHASDLIDNLISALSKKQRIELRGFGSFDVNYLAPRIAHNPKTGKRITTEGKHRVRFKPSKELRARVDYSSNK